MLISPYTRSAAAARLPTVPALHDPADFLHILFGIEAPIAPVAAHIRNQSFFFPPEESGLGNVKLFADVLGLVPLSLSLASHCKMLPQMWENAFVQGVTVESIVTIFKLSSHFK